MQSLFGISGVEESLALKSIEAEREGEEHESDYEIEANEARMELADIHFEEMPSYYEEAR